MPYHQEVVQMLLNIKNYLARLQASYNSLFCGQEMYKACPTLFDRTGFLLDNQLLNYCFPITKNDTMDLVMVTIGPS
eukprot:13750079-Ditylum_brightwellii.AAC.1